MRAITFVRAFSTVSVVMLITGNSSAAIVPMAISAAKSAIILLFIVVHNLFIFWCKGTKKGGNMQISPPVFPPAAPGVDVGKNIR